MATGGPNVGYASLQVIPSVRGMRQQLQRQMGAPARAAGAAAGQDAGRGFASSFGSLAAGAARVAGRAVTDTLAAAGRTAMRGLEGAAVATGAVVATSLVGGFSRLTAIDDARGKLRGLGHDTEAIATIMESALDSVRGTAFGLGEAATTSATAVAAGIEPGKELTRYLKTVADTATITGSSLGEIGSIINKTTTDGRVFTMELRQLADRGLPVFTWLADAYGVSAEELREMVSAGEVDAKRFREVLEENIGGAALASGETFRGGFANVRAAMGRMGAEMLEPFFEASKDAFPSLIAVFDELAGMVGPAMTRIAESPGFRRFTAWIEAAPDHLRELLPRLREVGPALAPIGAALAAMSMGGMSRLLGPFGAIIPAINPLVAAFAALVLTNDELRDAFGRLGGALVDFGRGVGEALAPLAERLFPIFVDALVAVVDFAGRAVTALADLVDGGLGVLSGWWDASGTALVDGIKELAGDAFAALSKWWDDHGETVTEGMRAIGNAAKDVLAVGFDVLKVAADGVMTGLNEIHQFFSNNDTALVGALATIGTAAGLAFGAWALSAGAAAAATLTAAGAALLALAPFALAAIGVGLLAAGLYWAWNNWDWFREAIWAVQPYIEWVIDKVEVLVGWLKQMVEWIGKAQDAWEKIPTPSDAWGGLGDFFAGRSVPRPWEHLPGFDSGGVMPGPRGVHSLAWVAGGETILPTHKRDFEVPVQMGGSQHRSVEAHFHGVDRDTADQVLARLSWEVAR